MGIKELVKKAFSRVEKEAKVIKGEETKDKVYKSKKTFDSLEEAEVFLEEARKRLFDVNKWSYLPKLINSVFQLYTPQGARSSAEKPVVGDYISIELPGPFPLNWVRVLDIKEGEDFSEFTVAPSEDPTDKENTEQIKHFFHKEATSTFRIERKGNTMHAYEIGKNEAVNTEDPESGNREVVNTVVAEGGWAAFQKIQWKNLTDYLVGLI
jgi:hypothetical protein